MYANKTISAHICMPITTSIIKIKHVLEIILNFNISFHFNFFYCQHIKNIFFTSQAPGRPAKISKFDREGESDRNLNIIFSHQTILHDCTNGQCHIYKVVFISSECLFIYQPEPVRHVGR